MEQLKGLTVSAEATACRLCVGGEGGAERIHLQSEGRAWWSVRLICLAMT